MPKSSDGVRQLRHGAEKLLPPIGNLAKPESHPILPETHPGGILVVCISTLLLGLICVSFMVAILSQMERDCHPPMLEPPLHLSSTANPLDCHKEDSSRLSRRSQGTRCRRPAIQFLSVFFSQSDLTLTPRLPVYLFTCQSPFPEQVEFSTLTTLKWKSLGLTNSFTPT